MRLLLAAACQAVDDHDRASLECDAARQVFEELGAAPALAHLEQLAARSAAGPSSAGPTSTDADSAAPPITDRELEVLRLVAAGDTNREIAGELFISEKTVERHLANIFTKLGVANRAAATAHAYDHGYL